MGEACGGFHGVPCKFSTDWGFDGLGRLGAEVEPGWES